jgi:hypothetical protein
MCKNLDVRLPPREACTTCPYYPRRLRFELPGQPNFKELVENHSAVSMVDKGHASALDPTPLAFVRNGVDPFVPAAQVVRPGFEDFDRIEDLETLTLALRDNDVQPVCDCARRLLDAVGEAPWPGPAIAARAIVAEEPPLLTPTKVKAPGCRKPAPANIFAAFGEGPAPVAMAPKPFDGVSQDERPNPGAEERDWLRGLPGAAGAVQCAVWGDSDEELDQFIDLETS